MVERELPDAPLLRAIKASLPELDRLHAQVCDHWGYEDGVYRFYHQSFKVYRLQDLTTNMVEVFRRLLPDRELNAWFREIVSLGTGKRFDNEHNKDWLLHTRPIVEAFLHAKYFLEMICRYGRELEQPPQMLPSGWAAVLYLYDMR